MNTSVKREHSIGALFTVLLFGMFVLFLLLMILFSARAYQAAVDSQDKNYNLYTVMSYVTTKLRQHDSPDRVFPGKLQDREALCLLDEIDGQSYTTYIFMDGQELKELFTASSTEAVPAMGTAIASMNSFSVEETEEGFYRIFMEDTEGASCSLILHPGSPLS